ncbi:RNase HI [Tessaracoccus flavus]|nr:RNase HI [Tessaracoccus flavus]
MVIVAAADGSSLSNPGPAGWAWYISDDAWAAGGWEHGTNNMGELMAVLDLLRSTAHLDEPLRILCDSQYVINSLTKWMPGWKRKGWKKGDGKPVLNVELMKDLDAAMRGRELEFEWVKGHAGHRMNEAADERARAAATAYQQGREPDHGPGFPEAPRPLGRRDFLVGQSDPEPDLFTFADDAADAPRAVEGSAPPRMKARLVTLTRDSVLNPLETPLHPDYVGHAGGAVTDSGVPWRAGGELELLAIDQLAPGVGLARWRLREALHSAVWVELPSGWCLRFAQ